MFAPQGEAVHGQLRSACATPPSVDGPTAFHAEYQTESGGQAARARRQQAVWSLGVELWTAYLAVRGR
jgi:hypothetical protein